MLLTLAAFVFVLGVLIFVHEAGHFLVAKATGVQVLRFSLGFGKPLVQFTWGETEYVIAMLPFGGYVKMAGLEEEGMMGQVEGGTSTVPVDPARAFDRKPLPSRIAVILAGVTMNFLFAWFVYSALAATVGSAELNSTQIDTVMVSELPAGAGAVSTLKRGDRILTVSGDSVHSWDQLREALIMGRTPVTLGISGRTAPIVLDSVPRAEDRAKIADALVPAYPAKLAAVTAGGPGDQGGLRPGDVVVHAGTDSISNWTQFQRVIRANPRRTLDVTVRRGDSTRTFAVTLGAQRDTSSGKGPADSVGLAGVLWETPITRQRFSGVGAVQEGWRQTAHALGIVFGSLKMLVTHEASLRDLGGPIAIGKMSGDAARSGFSTLLEWMSLLSVNLALLNLLPIPILDGGQLVFLIAEGIRRRPLSIELRLRLTQVGFIFIVALMLFVVGNDLLRYVIH